MKEQIQLRDFLDFSYISDVQTSPDEQQISYLVTQSDIEHNAYISKLHLWRDGKDITLTTSGKEHLYLWENEDTLLFSNVREESDAQALQNGEERTVFYRISIHGGEAQKAFSIPLTVNGIKQVNAGTYVVCVTYALPYSHAYEAAVETKQQILKEKKENADYEVLEELPFYTNGGGYTNAVRNTLFLYDSKEEKLTRISEQLFQVSDFTLNEERTKLYYTGSSYHQKQGRYEGIYSYDLTTLETKELMPADTYSIQKIICWGEQLLIAAADQQHYGLNENPKFYLFDLHDQQLHKLCDFDQALGNSVGSDARLGKHNNALLHKDSYYFIATIGYSSVLYELKKNGSLQMIYDAAGSVDGFVYTSQGLYLYGMYDTRPQELYYIDEHKQRHLLTNYHQSFIERKDIRQPQHLSFMREGISLDGWVLLPSGYDAQKTYPAILDIHGGPKTVYGEVYYHEMQVWANLGYVVFFMNPRGSDGKGNAFADLRGAYGTFDYEDIMAFTDLVLETYPAIDQARLGVTGGSYGGFMTNWIITHTNRFKAAASQRSIANWISFVATSDIGEYFGEDQQQADIWSKQDKLWWHSPLRYADQCKTPTLFIHSNEDYRCPYSEGLQMYSALCMHGVKTRLCMFKGENHELSRSGLPKHRIRRLEEITSWLSSHLQ